MNVPALIATALLSTTSPGTAAKANPDLPPAVVGEQATSPDSVGGGLKPVPSPADISGQTTQPSERPVEEGDIIVVARTRNPADPLATVNAQSFAATAAMDRAIGGPAALAYKRIVPDPIRSGIRNFFYNLHEPVVFFNFVLQHKFGKAAETLARFTINTTVGAAGLVDVAKRRPFELPRRANGFADTLGFYGVKPGPFFYVPLIGPTTLRDLTAGFIDRLFLPIRIGKPFTSPAFNISTGVVRGLDHRAEIDGRIRMLRDSPANDYDAARDFYLKRRQAEIDQLRGKPTLPDPAIDETGAPPMKR
ncbi:VacJ family lipoprotein [Sphingomonas panacisoli]|uniref:VacJ family lipoprotein n=1 Tax=Sphingomonas panacisoli TaxID=1813879 RepID=A0A5B8LJ77_9SPHN|nr:VacJ family lipoprotein [Sphingomonas panacisoli]QDZ07909.1 VacJ family lipoprotein [Sphingomonas panacisoli]